MCKEVRQSLYYLPLLFIALLVANTARAEESDPMSPQGKVYKDVAPDGTVTFTDQPTPDSEQVKVPKGSEYQPPKTPGFTPYQEPKPAAKFQYDSLSFVEPQDEVHFWNNAGNFTASVSLEPFLQSGNSIEFLLDGAVVAKGTATSHQFENIPRGEHQITARVVDSQDQVLISNKLTIYVHRTSIR